VTVPHPQRDTLIDTCLAADFEWRVSLLQSASFCGNNYCKQVASFLPTCAARCGKRVAWPWLQILEPLRARCEWLQTIVQLKIVFVVAMLVVACCLARPTRDLPSRQCYTQELALAMKVSWGRVLCERGSIYFVPVQQRVPRILWETLICKWCRGGAKVHSPRRLETMKCLGPPFHCPAK
jgi:hypothetical protein